MKEGKKQFIAGAMAGSLLFSIAFDSKRLDATQDTEAWHRMAPELRLGYDLGILSPKAYEPYNWTSPIIRKDFEQAFDKAMQMLGISNGYDIGTLAQTKLINSASSRKKIRREEALDKIFQTLVLLDTCGYIRLPETEAALINFTDYKTPQKYETAMTYLVNRGIVKGFADGRLHAKRYLTNRDCVFLITRFYEAIATEKKNNLPRRQLSFIDLPLDHWILKQLEGLASVGGLSLVRLGSTFDGEAWLSTGEFASMAAGILVHFNRAEVLSEINAVCEKAGSGRGFDRKFLARVLAVILRNLAHLYPSLNERQQISYTDVKPGSDLAYDLQAIGNYGIQLGYVGGRFAGDEKMTRYEAVSILYAAIEPLITAESDLLTPGTNNSQLSVTRLENCSDPVTSEENNKEFDLDNFVDRIREKQKIIREILERKKAR
ncbi:MAG: S-layer homology domain-containing protein [Candidatus Riflebacteria bacterium]|nr:S-layer homology domain-containing protein [Candidatus Riflebacteria bacterium]